MRLFIAEKPSLARAIAEALPGPHKKTAHHIECGGGDIVAWCAGHILETAPPEAYNPEYRVWRLEHLPIVPREWKYEVSTPPLLKSIKTLLPKASRVVHAGDPDREGQLLVDEVLTYLGYRGPVDRILINDLSPKAVRRALASLEPNARYKRLSESALARQRADWLYGMNMTRLYTLLGRSSGYDGVLSVGRVQTPLLGLIVERDLAIESFKPSPYYVPAASLRAPDGTTFRATWKPNAPDGEDGEQPPLLAERATAEGVRRRVEGQRGVVTLASQEKKAATPPLPYSLADLQIDAGRILNLSAKAVLDACQSLYETHRLATYPRSDCAYLPEGHFSQAKEVLAALRGNVPQLEPLLAKADLTLRSKAWNDKKVTAHHAIIPTPNHGTSAKLGDTEQAVYELICRRYLAQFFAPFEYMQARLEVDFDGQRFVAHGRQIVANGWKAVADHATEDHDDGTPTSDEGQSLLPPLQKGDSVVATETIISEQRTQAPKRFNDASLLQAMCSVGKFVADPQVRRILSDADGIGTPATRAAIIETLFARGYVTRAAKAIVSTATGRALVKSLPSMATTPDMTALWEAAMRSIDEGEHTLESFLDRIHEQLKRLIQDGRAMGRLAVPAASGERKKQGERTHKDYGESTKRG